MAQIGQPLTFEDWQNLQNLQRQQSMAQALLSQPQQQGPYGGLANAGNDIAGAIMQNSYNNRMKQMFSPTMSGTSSGGMVPGAVDTGQVTNNFAVKSPGLFSRIGNLFSLGGSQ